MVSTSDLRATQTYRGYLILSVFVLSAANLGCWKKSDVEMPQAVIHGGSMVPAFLGEHFELQCEDCKFSFAVDANEIPSHSMATCPNCGFSENEYPESGVRASTRIELEEANGDYDRWDVVAFQFSDSSKNGIKRLVGFPGEEVFIRYGDIWIDGDLARRDMSIKRQMRVLCFDSDFAAPNGPSRLRQYVGSDAISVQEISDLTVLGQVDDDWWLAFQPVNCFRGASNRAPVATVRDNYGFNQTVNRRRLNDTQQLMVESDFQIGPRDTFTIFIRYENDFIGFCIDRKLGEVRIMQDSHVLARSNLELEDNRISVLASTVDGEFQLFVGEDEICHADSSERQERVGDLELPGDMLEEAAVLFRGVGRSNKLALERFRIYRDIYYTDRGRVKFQLGEDEYLVLGDNSPVSVDSRVWSAPFLSSRQIIGKVRLVTPK